MWYYDAVAYNYEKKTMTGLNDTHFGPADTLVRSQFAAVLHKMNETPEMEYTKLFSDVTENDWFRDADFFLTRRDVRTVQNVQSLFRGLWRNMRSRKWIF